MRQWVHSRLGSVSIEYIAMPHATARKPKTPTLKMVPLDRLSCESSPNPSQCYLSLKSNLSRESFHGTLSH